MAITTSLIGMNRERGSDLNAIGFRKSANSIPDCRAGKSTIVFTCYLSRFFSCSWLRCKQVTRVWKYGYAGSNSYGCDNNHNNCNNDVTDQYQPWWMFYLSWLHNYGLLPFTNSLLIILNFNGVISLPTLLMSSELGNDWQWKGLGCLRHKKENILWRHWCQKIINRLLLHITRKFAVDNLYQLPAF